MDEHQFVEEKLRAVPRGSVPVDLLDKLLADIPSEISPAVRLIPAKSAWWFAVAAALLLTALIALTHRPPAQSPERAVSIQFVIYHSRSNQETDPCSVFPPLANSRR